MDLFFAALPIAVWGLKNEEGNILKETFIPTLVYGIILAALAGLWLLVS
jgi:L-lactate permease